MATVAASQQKEPERADARSRTAAAPSAAFQAVIKPAAPIGRGPTLTNPQLLHLQGSVGNRVISRRIAAAGSPLTIRRTPVVLSSDANYAKKDFLEWFQDKVKAVAEGWGLSFSPDSVKLGKTGTGPHEKDAVILTWDGAWGAAPGATEIPFSMEPISARLAIAGVHRLAGWAKVAKDDQAVLDNLLGGEMNQLSAAARQHLFASFADLSKKNDTEQAAALKGTLTATTAQPDVVAEPVTTAKVEYTLEGPTTQKDYEFKGAKGDASIWKIKFKDGVEIELVAPKAPTPGFHNHTVEKTAESASYVAKAARSVVKTILLNANTNPEDAHWAVEYKTPDFHSYMTAGAAGIVTIYPDKTANALPTDEYMRGTMVHESGHTWSYKTWGTDKTKGRWLDWKAAMDKDKLHVSDYATKSIAEDVAETIQIYVTTQGSKRFDEYKNMVPARFAILASDYK
ncbi:MAG: hypothetical protein ABI577_09555 [bacterium]